MIRIVLFCLMLVTPAAAQDFPALYDVIDTASNDVLNIREKPSSKSQIIGAFRYNQTDIEVLAVNDKGTWGLVNVGETSGWTFMRYLKPHPKPSSFRIVNDLYCFGTEPFWSIRKLEQGRLMFRRIDHSDAVLGDISTSLSRNVGPWVQSIEAKSPSSPLSISGILSHQACSDGMTDQHYGMSLDILVHNSDEHILYSGCCTLNGK